MPASRVLYVPEAQGSPTPRAARSVRTGYAYQPRAYRTCRAPWRHKGWLVITPGSARSADGGRECLRSRLAPRAALGGGGGRPRAHRAGRLELALGSKLTLTLSNLLPTNPDSYPNQVAAQLASHGMPAAELLPPLQRALALQPLDAQVRQALATTLGALGRTDESASTLRAARSQ